MLGKSFTAEQLRRCLNYVSEKTTTVNLSALNTDTKTSLVSAINDVYKLAKENNDFIKSMIRSHTISLLHFDDPDNPWKDECGNTWTPEGEVSITEDNSTFGKCLYSPSSTCSGLISNPRPIGGADFTIDFNAKCIEKTTWENMFIMSLYSERNLGEKSRSGSLSIGKYTRKSTLTADVHDLSGKSQIVSNHDVDIPEVNVLSKHHYALVYSHLASTYKIFVDGKTIRNFHNVTIERKDRYMRLFSTPYNDEYFGAGYVDEFRIVDGLALWTDNFAPPTEPYSL